MTPKSDHDEDMSMDEILASIRKFVADNPHDGANKQETSKRNRPESAAVRSIRQEMTSRQQAGARQSYHSYTAQDQRQGVGRPQVRNPYSVRSYESTTPPYSQSQGSADVLQGSADVLELTNPLPSDSKSLNLGRILEDPIIPVKEGNLKQDELAPLEGNTASYALTASANSMSRLAQTAKSMQYKQATIPDSQNITIEQLIRDMVRPYVKEWVETNLHVLVEEMVAKEIKRITRHLE